MKRLILEQVNNGWIVTLEGLDGAKNYDDSIETYVYSTLEEVHTNFPLLTQFKAVNK